MGPLLMFPLYNSTPPGWSAMDVIDLQKSMNALLIEAEDLHKRLNQLSLRERRKIKDQLNLPVRWDPDFEPWGGLFPNPRFR